jgi:hypothetical protein
MVAQLSSALPVESGKKKISKNMVSGNIHYDKDCGTYTDCHDCVVSGCNYEVSTHTCVRDGNTLDTSTATLNRFFNKAEKCKDTLGICSTNVE